MQSLENVAEALGNMTIHAGNQQRNSRWRLKWLRRRRLVEQRGHHLSTQYFNMSCCTTKTKS
jgi:hypothetical protein